MNKTRLLKFMELYDRRCESIPDADRYISFLKYMGAIDGPQLSDEELDKRYWMVVDNQELSAAEKHAGLDLLSVYVVNCTTDRNAHDLLWVISKKQEEYLLALLDAPQETLEPVVTSVPVPTMPTPRPWDRYVLSHPDPAYSGFLDLFGIPLPGGAW